MSQDLAKSAADRGIRYFLISFVDLFGVLRAKLVPASAIGQMQCDGAAFAGFATHLDLTPADPDMFAIPDPASLIQMPWKPEIGWLAADLNLAGAPLEHTPRQVLKRQIADAEAKGYRMKTGVEAEFFVLRADGLAVADEADRQAKPCYDQAALLRRYELIRAISDAMLELGWAPYQSDHEDANGQFEMNWAYDDALVTADRHVFFKFMVKELAGQLGLRATFMPKPFMHLTGNGCHAHVSLWDRGGDINLFHDPRASSAFPRSPTISSAASLHMPRRSQLCSHRRSTASNASTRRRPCRAPPGHPMRSAMAATIAPIWRASRSRADSNCG
jgi:glutamine synthetase